jgi:hypothetical protein
LDGLVIVQSAQTAALLTVAGAVIYTLYLLRKELKGAASSLREVISNQSQRDQNVRRSWEHIDMLEAELKKLAAHLDRLDPPRPP